MDPQNGTFKVLPCLHSLRKDIKLEKMRFLSLWQQLVGSSIGLD